jgi:hypothetical protein
MAPVFIAADFTIVNFTVAELLNLSGHSCAKGRAWQTREAQPEHVMLRRKPHPSSHCKGLNDAAHNTG